MPEFAKDGFARFLVRSRGFTPSQATHFVKLMTGAGYFFPRGFDAFQAGAGIVGSAGATISHAPAAAGLFMPMRTNSKDDPRIPANTTLGEMLASILTQPAEDILAIGWQLTLMSNPAEAELITGGEVRRVFKFSAPPTDRVAYSSIRSAKIVPPHVLAELADLLANGESTDRRHAKVERSEAEGML